MSFVPPVHIEIPNSADFSIQTNGHGLSVEAWLRPDRLHFGGESRKKYIHWLGKGDRKKMEWGFRLYSSDHPDRPRQISAYAWNPQGYLGAGSYYKGNSVQEGEWLHVVACYDHYVDPCVKLTSVQLFVNGEIAHESLSPGSRYFNEGDWSVLPRNNDAPLRFATRSAKSNSFLSGAIDEVAIYPTVLTAQQIKCHFEVGSVA